MHLLEGRPGTGKTTIALKFLMEGASHGEPTLDVALSETVDELRSSAASHGRDLSGINIIEIVPAEARLDEQQSVLYPSEIDLRQTVQQIAGRN